MMRVVVLALLALWPPLALAHDVWITLAGDPAARRAIVHYGHPDDRPPAQADKIVDLVAIDAAAQRNIADGMAATVLDGNTVVASAPFADGDKTLVAARYDNGVWVKRSDGGWRNATRRMMPDAVESLWSGKFAKALTGAGAPWDKVLGHTLELVPVADPATLRSGDVLRLRVVFEGRPLPGAKVERGDGVTAIAEDAIPKFETDDEGVATVPIVGAGPHLLVVDHRVTPSRTPATADADLHTATLWFSTR